MKKLLLAFLVSGSSAAIAQPTITAAVHPLSGFSYSFNTAQTPPAMNAGGANQIWDFSTLTAAGAAASTTYASCPAAPDCSKFPGSTMRGTDGANANSFFAFSNNAWSITGAQVMGSDFIYSNPEDMIRYPFTYNDSYKDSFVANFTTSMSFVRSGEIEVTADGYGTLILPAGTFNDVLRVKGEEYYSDAAMGSTMFTYHSVNYFFYSPHEKELVARFNSISLNGGPIGNEFFTYTTRFGTGMNSETSLSKTLSIYPNPATDVLNIRFGMSHASETNITVSDLTGRQVLQQSLPANGTGIRETSIQTGNLPAGMYIIRIDANGQSATQKITVR